MNAQRNVITVDGLAGSGKTSISRELAERIHFILFSSGMLYRAAGLIAIDAGISLESEAHIMDALLKHTITMDLDKRGSPAVYLDGTAVAQDDRLVTPETSEAASKVAQHKAVREFLRDRQRNVFPGRSIIAEGRDMGTVIFPDASLKFFIQASVEIRTERRIRQLLGPNASGTEKSDLKKVIEIEILERDKRDENRAHSPTVPASDAIIIENSGGSLTQIVESMYDFVTQKGLAKV